MTPLAVAIYDILRKRVPSTSPWIYYGKLCELLEPRFGSIAPDGAILAAALGEIVDACRARELPALSAIVVHANAPHVPGPGYYPCAHPQITDPDRAMIAWAEEVEKVKRQAYPPSLLRRARSAQRAVPLRSAMEQSTLAPMRDFLDSFRTHLAAAGKSPTTIATYASIIEAFFAFTQERGGAVAQRTRADVEGFLARPRADGERRAARSRNQALAAIRAAARLSVRELGWLADPTAGIAFAKETRRDPTFLDAGEVRRLFLAAAGQKSDPAFVARDLAILALFCTIGLRVHELVALSISQLDLPSATVLAVKGKGGTSADLPLNAPAVTLLVAWLRVRDAVAQPGENALFVSRGGSRMSKRAVQHLITRLRDAIGTKKKLSCHTLRHTCATLALTIGGADVSTVAELLRHSDLNATRVYLGLVDTRRREAVRRLGAMIQGNVLDGTAGRSTSEAGQVLDGHALSGEPANDTANRLVIEDDFGDADAA